MNTPGTPLAPAARKSKRIMLFAAPLLAATTMLAGLANSPSAQATPSAPAAPAAPASKAINLQHVGHGSWFSFENKSGTGTITVAGEGVHNGHTTSFKGAHTGNDWSGQASFRDGTTVDLHANNPFTSEAYFQVGPYKIYREAYVKHNGKHFHVKFKATAWDTGDKVLYKAWDVTCTGDNGFYDHEFVHHLGDVDGVKGTVMNKTKKAVTLKAGGASMTLKPGQRMLYFDAGLYHGDRGTEFTVSNPDREHDTFKIEAVDPSIGYPKATVATGSGVKDVTHYSEKQSKSFSNDGGDLRVTVTRQGDHKLPCVYENFETSDWAVFDIDITDK